MDIATTAEDRRFRDEVREFAARSLPDDIRDRWVDRTTIFPDFDDSVRWQKILHRKGWVAPMWPVEWGGTGWSNTKIHIFEYELGLAGAPPINSLPYRMIGPVLIRYGTEEQKRRHLPRILASDESWCQGYSEPSSGSDLASLGCRAARDGDDYVVNGSKIWTTYAHNSDWMFCLVRTSRETRKQDGISFLLIDMATPGLEVRPLITLAGDHEINQVFFTDVRVPRSNLVGEEGRGWEIAKYLLEFERGGNFAAGRIALDLESVRRMAAVTGADRSAAFRRRLAEAEIAFQGLALAELCELSRLEAGQNPGNAASMIKLSNSNMLQRLTELGVEAAGPYAMPFEQLAEAAGLNQPPVWTRPEAASAGRYFNHRGVTIMGGSNEVQYGILAKHALGL